MYFDYFWKNLDYGFFYRCAYDIIKKKKELPDFIDVDFTYKTKINSYKNIEDDKNDIFDETPNG